MVSLVSVLAGSTPMQQSLSPAWMPQSIVDDRFYAGLSCAHLYEVIKKQQWIVQKEDKIK
jgi:hypothetical protein